ncbi:MAG: VOC family protein [Candidatus Aenigmarchaeota archaeon]|nr:VOC family protein [Candidatus Aenigmarchaeota archaeon]
MDRNPVGWFEIPVSDMERAIKFYAAVFGHKLERHTLPALDMAWFPMHPDGMGAMGSLVFHKEFYTPSANGALVYFTAFSGDLANELARVALAGGKILVPKTKISDEHGFMAVILDSEGNRIALHSRR